MSLANVTNANGISKGHLPSVEYHGIIAMTLRAIKRLAGVLRMPPFLVFSSARDNEIAEIEKLIRRSPPSYLPKVHQEVLKLLADDD